MSKEEEESDNGSGSTEPRNARRYPPMSAATAVRLREHFAADNADLEALVGQPMDW